MVDLNFGSGGIERQLNVARPIGNTVLCAHSFDANFFACVLFFPARQESSHPQYTWPISRSLPLRMFVKCGFGTKF